MKNKQIDFVDETNPRFLYKLIQFFLVLGFGLAFENEEMGVLAAEVPPTDSQDYFSANNIEQFGNSEFIGEQKFYAQPNILSQLPNPVPPRPEEEEIPLPRPVPETPLEVTPPSESETEPFGNIPGTVTVSEFNFQGNTAFSEEELQQEIANFTGEPITFSQLLQVEEIIRNKYTEGCRSPDEELPCYINSGAVIAADQTIDPEDATITVNVIEGELESIEIRGARGLNESYIRSRLEAGISKPLERDELIERLQLLQLDPLITNISAELSAGSRPNKSTLQVDVVEADPFFVELFTDNGRAPSVGSWRRGIRINENNLLGFGDSLFFQYANTDGSDAFDTAYSAPLNSSNTTLNIAGGVTNTEIVEEPFDRAEIKGESFNFEIGVRQPIIRTPTKELALGITTTRQESNTEVLGENFALSPGADEDGETRISALRFFQEYTNRDLRQVLALRSQFSIGLDAFNSTVNDDFEAEPDSRFLTWRGQGQYVRRLGRDTLLVFRSDLQFATTTLVPLEQFSVGGLQSVRGYRQDALLTDNGFFSSAEVRIPLLRAESVQGVLQFTPFVDLGVGWNNDSENNPNPDDQFLVGLGVGLQWQMNNLTARIDYGIPLVDVENDGETLQEDGIYFSLTVSPF